MHEDNLLICASNPQSEIGEIPILMEISKHIESKSKVVPEKQRQYYTKIRDSISSAEHDLTFLQTAELGDCKLLNLILKSVKSLPYNINANNSRGETALHSAVNQLNLAVVQILLKHGAYANMLNSQSDSPLHCACRKFANTNVNASTSVDIIEELCNHGAVSFPNVHNKLPSDIVNVKLTNGKDNGKSRRLKNRLDKALQRAMNWKNNPELRKEYPWLCMSPDRCTALPVNPNVYTPPISDALQPEKSNHLVY